MPDQADSLCCAITKMRSLSSMKAWAASRTSLAPCEVGIRTAVFKTIIHCSGTGLTHINVRVRGLLSFTAANKTTDVPKSPE
jgi:hypothetical protein